MLESFYDNNRIHSFSSDEHTEASDGDTFSIVIKRVSCCFIQERHPQFSALQTITSLGTESISRSATDSLGQSVCWKLEWNPLTRPHWHGKQNMHRSNKHTVFLMTVNEDQPIESYRRNNNKLRLD